MIHGDFCIPANAPHETRVAGVFEGGGIKGIALAGAASAALGAGYVFEASIGTSAGALVGSLLSAGYDGDELREAVCRTPWPEMMDPTPLTGIPGIGKHLSMLAWKGMYRGDRLEEIWRALLEAKGIRTFGDLPRGSLRVITTDLTHGRGLVLPDDLPAYGKDPDSFPVARAVRMSATVPFVFQPLKLRNQTNGDVSYVADGAMAAKFPVQVAHPHTHADDDSIRPTIGFRLGDGEQSHPHIKIRGPLSLATAVIGSGITARESLPSLCSRLNTVVTIDIDRDPLDFDTTPAEARAMFDQGYEQAGEFFGVHPVLA